VSPLTQPRSTSKPYDVAGVIGRFQGPQEGHLRVVGKALEVAERVAVGIGSANVARDTRNPWTFEERREMLDKCIRAEFAQSDADRITFTPLDDTPYDKPAWIASVNHMVRSATKALRPRVGLVGNIRDQTSEYLTWFRAWDFVPVRDTGTNATALRKAFFSGSVNFDTKDWNDGFDWHSVPAPTIEFLCAFRDQPAYAYLMAQLKAETEYKAKWGSGPFLTADPVVIAGDHLLMIERGGPEGTGRQGLPGGFVNAGERLLWAAARECVEETGLFISDDDLPGFRSYLMLCKMNERDKRAAPPMPECAIKAIQTLTSYLQGEGQRFDDPNRSRRGHLITEAFLFQLPDGHGLPRVTGLDDAKRAFWMPISEVNPIETFEDHAHIADFMISRYANF